MFSERFHFLLLRQFVFLVFVLSIVDHYGKHVSVDINVLVDIELEVYFLLSFKLQFNQVYLVSTPRSVPPNNNPVYVLNNDDLPDYETTIKDSSMKDLTPPPYNFVTTHPNDFGIDARVPSAPPQYNSRRSSLATNYLDAPIN